MAEGREGPRPDLKGARFRQGLRETRLGRAVGFKQSSQRGETPVSPAGGDGEGNEPPAPPTTPLGGEGGNGNGDENPREEQESAREGTDTAHEPESPAEAIGSILEGLPEISESLTDEEIRIIRENSGAEAEDVIRIAGEQRKALKGYLDSLKRSAKAGLVDPMKAYGQLNEAVRQGEVSIIDAEQYLDAIATDAIRTQGERLQRPGSSERGETDEANATGKGIPRGTEQLKEWIRGINPDNVTMDPKYLQAIAKDEEAAEMFLDKIISKPFAAPEDQYRLSFYADINLSGFLTEVNAISRERHTEYVRKKETSLRFHEMNRTIISESGNPDAFLSISRSVTPRHLQTATEITGVEYVRQLIEIAYGRLYARTNRLLEGDFEPEILDRVTRQFYQEAGYQWSEGEGRWKYQGGETIKSKFLDANGNQKHLEDWEVERAIAFGRNIHAAFYRHSELISWSSIPKEGEEWLKSMPSETVVRVFSGLKTLAHRFRMGATGGGPQFTRLIYDKIQDDYNKLKMAGKIRIEKIGKLDIKEDLIPTGFFKGAGFDKGWRTLIAYLDTSVAKIDISDLSIFSGTARAEVQKFITQYGDNPTLYEFLIKQEYAAQVAASIKAEVAGVEIPEELRYFDSKEQAKLVEQILMPIMDQVNLSLGVMISFGAASKNVRGALWTKAADFLPLTVAYKLSEEGVRGISGYEHVKGEGGNLFSDEFEGKLIRAQHLRIQEQKRAGNVRVNLNRFFEEAELTPGEINFAKALQQFGRDNAGELAQVSFPHIPFLDDVPFEDANYIALGAEVFPRRIGGDFRAYKEATDAYDAIPNNLTVPYENFLETLRKVEDSLSGPEGPKTAQEVGFPILKTYFEFAKQWGWTRLPLVKPVREFMGKPTSWLQNFYGRKSPSWAPSEINTKANDALSHGVLRREQFPGEERSQMDALLQSMGGAWLDVVKEHGPKAGMFFLVTMLMAFLKEIRGIK